MKGRKEVQASAHPSIYIFESPKTGGEKESRFPYLSIGKEGGVARFVVIIPSFPSWELTHQIGV